MVGRVLHHASRHSVGYLALACSMLALAGASYAAIHIPDHSVNTKQLRNGAVTEKKIHNQTIDPVKWDPIYVTAFVRRYAQIDVNGRVVTGSPNTQSAPIGGVPGNVDVTWSDAFNATCIAQATVTSAPGVVPGFANTTINLQPNNATVVNVRTFNQRGEPTSEPFSLAIICPRGAGGGQRYPYVLP